VQLDLADGRFSGLGGLVRPRPWLRRQRDGRWAQTGLDGPEALQRLGEIGDDLLTLVAGQRPHGRQVLLRLVDQPVDDRQRRPLVLVQLGDLLVRAAPVGDRPDQGLQLDARESRRHAHAT
jgi:hypothetical protein